MRVDESKAGKSIAAFIILKGDSYVGKIQAHFGDSRVTVNVWSWTGEESQYAESSASGYGYDKLTAALSKSGVTFDGLPIYDHCQSKDVPGGIAGLEARGFKVIQAI